MNFLIDGHNLIGSNLFPDIRLSDVDDEAKLVRRLRIWQSRTRTPMTVVFDRGIPGGIDVKMGSSGVEVIFAADPVQADDLIRRRLRKAKKGLILITNDDALVQEAAVYGVTCWRGVEFVEQMKPKIRERLEEGTEDEIQISKDEMEEWLAIFRARWLARKALKQKRSADGPSKPKADARGKAQKQEQKKSAKKSGPKQRGDGGKRR